MNLQEAKLVAETLSRENPGVYVMIDDCFGLHVRSSKRLNVFDPTSFPWWFDEADRGYWISGKFKHFTAAQKLADQNATPTMT